MRIDFEMILMCVFPILVQPKKLVVSLLVLLPTFQNPRQLRLNAGMGLTQAILRRLENTQQIV